jgi:glycine/serine hydroxymethyltransferase
VAAERLDRAGIRVNELPHLPGIEGPSIRLGVQEAVWHGMGPDDAAPLADLMAAAVYETRPAGAIRTDVAALRASWPGLPSDEAAVSGLRWLTAVLEKRIASR